MYRTFSELSPTHTEQAFHSTSLRSQLSVSLQFPTDYSSDKGGNMTFIDDAYNSNPSGCRAALNVLGLFDACRILVTPGMVELGAKQEELNFEFGQEAAKACDHIVLVGKNQTVPIYNGIKDAGYDMDNVFVADSLNEALDHVRAYQTDRKKIVLLENDLPDNY